MKRYIFTVVLTLLLFIATTVSLFMRLPVFAQTSTPTSTPTQGANIGQPITFDAPLIFSGEQTISAYKFVDSTNSDYFLDPSSSGNSLILSGNVGIGTTSPGATLDVYSGAGLPITQRLSGYAAANRAVVGSLDFYNTYSGASNVQGQIKVLRGLNDYKPGQLGFFTSAASTGTLSERMTIDEAGNVGIGTTAPSSISKIHVVGPYSTTFGANYGLLLESTSYAQYSKTNIGLGIVQGGYPQALIGFDQLHSDGNDRSGDLVFGTAIGGLGPTMADAPPVENMRITHDGNVGIGTTAPTVQFERACPAGFTNVKAGNNQLGCMETAEHGTGSFYTAADTCFTTYGGSLPIYSEWYIAMNNYVLTDETDDWEWLGSSDLTTAGNKCALCGATAITVVSIGLAADTYSYRCWLPR